MAYRCENCNVFCSIANDDDNEVVSLDLDAGGRIINGEVRLVLNSECCGDEVAESHVDFEIDIDDMMGDDIKLEDEDGSVAEIENDEPVGDVRYQDTDKHGRKIKSMRYQRKYYVASFQVMLTDVDGAEHTADVSVESQASEFEPV